MNWSVLPDLVAIALLICAFASTARRNYSPTASMWLIAWLMIALHFLSALFTDLPGVWGALAQILNVVALTWEMCIRDRCCGVMRYMVVQRQPVSSSVITFLPLSLIHI